MCIDRQARLFSLSCNMVFRRNVLIRFIVLKLLSESAVEIGVTRTISSSLDTSENVSSSPFSFMNFNSSLILEIPLKLSFAYKTDNSHFSLSLFKHCVIQSNFFNIIVGKRVSIKLKFSWIHYGK